jgi:VAMP-associated protein involved in inositol metabolism
MDSTSYALEVSPESTLQFTLTRDASPEKAADGTARCVMTLKHPGNSSYLAFKVKTTQPRRYLVRPNQGIVAPGSTETINIVLVEKEKQILLQSFDRLGQSALDHSKDKFLVQSCVVDESFAKNYLSQKDSLNDDHSPEAIQAGKELTESLISMWNAVNAADDVQIFNRKLQVRHVVPPSSAAAGETPSGKGPSSRAQLWDKTSLENMTQEQMFMEISTLRRKYDELVTFSVNLTAERDILNNTLEQTKRDLNREIAKRKDIAASSGGKDGKGDVTVKKSGGGMGLVSFLFFAIVIFLVAVKLSMMGKVDFLLEAPVLGDLMRMEL